MPDRVGNEGVEENGTQVHIEAVRARTVLQLTSYLPEVAQGCKPVCLGAIELPARVGTAHAGRVRILTLGPAEWWLVGREISAEVEALSAVEREAQGLVISDFSSAISVFEVSGAGARALFAKACGLEIDGAAFLIGTCARTRFANLSVVIDLVQGPDRFELYVGRSFTPYLTAWLADAGTKPASERIDAELTGSDSRSRAPG